MNRQQAEELINRVEWTMRLETPWWSLSDEHRERWLKELMEGDDE